MRSSKDCESGCARGEGWIRSGTDQKMKKKELAFGVQRERRLNNEGGTYGSIRDHLRLIVELHSLRLFLNHSKQAQHRLPQTSPPPQKGREPASVFDLCLSSENTSVTLAGAVVHLLLEPVDGLSRFRSCFADVLDEGGDGFDGGGNNLVGLGGVGGGRRVDGTNEEIRSCDATELDDLES